MPPVFPDKQLPASVAMLNCTLGFLDIINWNTALPGYTTDRRSYIITKTSNLVL